MKHKNKTFLFPKHFSSYIKTTDKTVFKTCETEKLFWKEILVTRWNIIEFTATKELFFSVDYTKYSYKKKFSQLKTQHCFKMNTHLISTVIADVLDTNYLRAIGLPELMVQKPTRLCLTQQYYVSLQNLNKIMHIKHLQTYITKILKQNKYK